MAKLNLLAGGQISQTTQGAYSIVESWLVVGGVMPHLSMVPLISESTNEYIAVETPMTWSSAQSFCRKSYTDLASIRSQKELEEILRTADPGSSKVWWIGLFRDSWKWSDQSDLSFTVWENGEPNNYVGDEFCVQYTDKKWNDLPCSMTAPFFCYSGEFHP
uniref:C-type lectin domain-containing protein n=1 Tax=Myripristis murdjan TaxID=586833 RepID=A0A667YUF3_9TELE